MAQMHRFAPLGQLPAPWQAQLRTLCAQFLGSKTISGAAGLVVTPQMQLHIAAQACLPIVRLGLDWYRGWRGIVVYPAPFRVRRRVQDADGLEHESDDTLAGEAWDGGPVVLSWQDSDAAPASPDARLPAANVVIHEFAHTLDLLGGSADGVPPFDRRLHAGLAAAPWKRTLTDAYERFCAELDLIDTALPRDIDPEGPQADPYYAHLPLDPYAGTDPAEFFAVSSETLFLQPDRLALAFPDWAALLHRFYRLDAAPGTAG